MRGRRLVVLAALSVMLIAVPVSSGHPLGKLMDSRDSRLVPSLPGGFPGEGIAGGEQVGAAEARLAPVDRGVDLIGKAEVTNPAGSGNLGRIADVSAYKDHAFLTAFREPTCERAGAHVIDISDPEEPFEVESAFMETTPYNYAGEGSQTLRMRNRYFDGVLFLHQNETCPNAPAPIAERTRGGINLWDVTKARRPKSLVKHAGDYTNARAASTLGRRLRDARRHEPARQRGQPDVRVRLPGARRGAPRPRAADLARGQRPPVRDLARERLRGGDG